MLGSLSPSNVVDAFRLLIADAEPTNEGAMVLMKNVWGDEADPDQLLWRYFKTPRFLFFLKRAICISLRARPGAPAAALRGVGFAVPVDCNKKAPYSACQ